MATRKDIFLGALATVATCCAIVVSTIAVMNYSQSQRKVGARNIPTTQMPDWRSYTKEGIWIGPRNARVVVLAWSDFQCPACRFLHEALKPVRSRHPEDIAVVYRHLPLAGHRYAFAAAEAADCAGRQGRFEEYHNALFDAQDSLGIISWRKLAEVAGIARLDEFDQCISQSDGANVARDADVAKKLGIAETPTVVVNGLRFRGAPNENELEQVVRRELKKPAS